MKILTYKQLRAADKAAMARDKISSLELMERAARQIAGWIEMNVDPDAPLLICCGRGGNGGDGLAAARILSDMGRKCTVFLAAPPNEFAGDAGINLAHLPRCVKVLDSSTKWPDIQYNTVIIDALLGIGAKGPVREPAKSITKWLNRLPNLLISIDLPSGMTTEWGTSKMVVRADVTLSIESPKLSVLQPLSGENAGQIVVLPIGLDTIAETPYHYITEDLVESLRLPRLKFSHKGSYGHALLICGSKNMPGAAILATGGALRSGCGLITAHVPENEHFAITANHPSAMLSLDPAECFSTPPEHLERFSAIGIGCGLGRDRRSVDGFRNLLTRVAGADVEVCHDAGSGAKIPMIFDADALNILAENPDLQRFIPVDSILTPHPGELRRLVGEWVDDREKLEKTSRFDAKINSVVIVKGSHSVVCTPDGRFLFNSSGTSGMAKGGSGDVLTGLITGLRARGYSAVNASVIGVYIHGRAGERAAEMYGVEAMNAADLAEFL